MDTKLLIAEDHGMLRASIKVICESIDIRVADEVDSCKSLIEQLKKAEYTHLILDLLLSDGDSLDMLDLITKEYPLLFILVYSSHPSFIYRVPLWKKYKCGYISKAEPQSATIKQLIDFLLKSVPPYSMGQTEDRTSKPPSEGEMMVAHYLLLGWSTSMIAKKLGDSVKTVQTLKSRMFKKAHVRKVAELKMLDYGKLKEEIV